jgi:uncharacterized protein (TIRG00374 family)
VPTEKKKKKSVKISIFLSILLSIGFIALILYFTIDATTIAFLTTMKINYAYFFAAIVVSFLFWGLWRLRLQILSNAIDPKVHISLWESTKIIFANLFLANITPSMAGGEPVRIYLLNKNGLNIGGATAAVLGERILDALFLLICVPFAFFFFGRYLTAGLLQIGLGIAVFVFILVLIIFVYAIRRPEKTKRILIKFTEKLRRLLKKDTSEKIINRISTEIDNFHETMTYFMTKGKKTFLIAGVITILFWGTGWIIPILLLLSLGLEPPILASTSAQILLVIIAMMPTTPGSTGVSEGGAAALYGVFIGSSLLGVFVLLFRFVTFHLGLIVGAIFQYRIFKSITTFTFDKISTDKDQQQ